MYKYKALNEDGEYIEGELNLHTLSDVENELLRLKYVPITIKEIRSKSTKLLFLKRQKKFDIEQFFENIYDYLDSGLSIDKALELESKSFEGDPEMEFLSELVESVRQGGSVSEAMQKSSGHFNELYIGIVSVGEETDSLSESFSLLSRLTHDLQEFQQKIKSAMVYPMILLGVMLLSIIVLFGLVIPRFKSLFVGMGVEMTGVTSFIVNLSDILTENYQLITVLFIAFIFLIRKLYVDATSSQSLAKYFIKAPLIGLMIKQYNLYIISMVMHILMKKKIPIIKALDHLRYTVSNVVYKDEIALMIKEVSQGGSIQSALRDNFFTQHFKYIVGVGEETGRLTQSFAKLSTYYYKQLDVRIRLLMTFAEPAIIIILGLVVGLIVVSMLQAILSINELTV